MTFIKDLTYKTHMELYKNGKEHYIQKNTSLDQWPICKSFINILLIYRYPIKTSSLNI